MFYNANVLALQEALSWWFPGSRILLTACHGSSLCRGLVLLPVFLQGEGSTADMP